MQNTSLSRAFFVLILLCISIVLPLSFAAITFAENAGCVLKAEPSSGPAPLIVKITVDIDTTLPQPLQLGKWHFSDGASEIAFLPSTIHTFREKGEYMVAYMFADAAGNKYSCNTEITVSNSILQDEGNETEKEEEDEQRNEPADEVLNITLRALPKKGFAPLQVDFSLAVEGGTPPFSLSIDFGDGLSRSSSDKFTVSHKYAEEGRYVAAVFVEDANGLSGEANITVNVLSKDRADKEIEELFKQATSSLEETGAEEEPQKMKDLASILDTQVEGVKEVIDDIDSLSGDKREEVKAKVLEGAKDMLLKEKERVKSLAQKPEDVSADEVSELVESTGKLMKTMIKKDIPLSTDILSEAKELVHHTLIAGIDDIAEKKGVSAEKIKSIVQDPQKAKEFFKEHPAILKKAIQKTCIPVGCKRQPDEEKVKEKIERLGGDANRAKKIADSIEPTVDAAMPLVAEDGRSKAIYEIVAESIGVDEEDITIDNVTSTIIAPHPDDRKKIRSMGVMETMVVSSLVDNETYDMPDGTKMHILSGISMHCAPASIEPLAVMTEFDSLGFNASLKNDGRISLQSGNEGVMLGGSFGWNVTRDNSVSAGAMSFEVQGTDIASESFSLLVRYADGSAQALAPSIVAYDDFINFLDAALPDQYRIDRDTGVIDLSSIDAGLWRPDYTFTPLASMSEEETSWYEGHKDGNGIAFDARDENGDGFVDVIFYSNNPSGKQTIYFVTD